MKKGKEKRKEEGWEEGRMKVKDGREGGIEEGRK